MTGKSDSLTEENFIFEPQNTDADVTESFIDPNFQAEIRKSLEIGEDEPIFKSACATIPYLELRGDDIKSLEGIKNLSGLTKLLCGLKQLKSLDVSGLKSLKTMALTSGQLESINVSGCTALTSLECYNNQLKLLDISYCVKLQRLYCSRNQLTGIDISYCPELTELVCTYNNMKSQDDIIGDISNITNQHQ